MEILHTLNDASFNASNLEDLKKQIIDYYSYKGYNPKVEIIDDIVKVSFDDSLLVETELDFDKAADFCNKGQLDKAQALLEKVIKVCPLHSEAYRTLAQIHMEKGLIDEAIDINIDALKADPRNMWALILMGNLYTRNKKDIDTAEKYYNKVLEYYPDNLIAINNVAGVMLEQKKYDKGIELMKQVLEKDDTYMNSYYGLALAYYKLGKYDECFDAALKGSIKSVDRKENPGVRQELLKLLLTSAKDIVDRTNYANVIEGTKDLLEDEGKTPISIEIDDNQNTYARLKYAKFNNLKSHIITHKSNSANVEHYILHEMMHLDMMIKAHNANSLYAIGTDSGNKANFDKRFSFQLDKLSSKIGSAKVKELSAQLFNGLVLQLMNCPIDLLVEDKLYEDYKMVRPLQLLSLFAQEQDNINTVKRGFTNKDIPSKIVTANKIMNMVTSLHLKDLFGINLLNE